MVFSENPLTPTDENSVGETENKEAADETATENATETPAENDGDFSRAVIRKYAIIIAVITVITAITIAIAFLVPKNINALFGQ